jgi:uncharacterized membrane protein YraQ (UPF0718 family)
LSMAVAMGWEILWPLVLGFALSAVVQAVVSHREMARLLPNDGPRSIATALALGAASSSCSYAAVALARSLFRKGADFRAAMAFEMASTNLVAELSIILIVLMGWRSWAFARCPAWRSGGNPCSLRCTSTPISRPHISEFLPPASGAFLGPRLLRW